MPVPSHSQVSQIGANGWFRWMTPEWLPVTSTWSSATALSFHSETFMRSSEYLTSSASSSPISSWLVPSYHMMPFFSSKAIVCASG